MHFVQIPPVFIDIAVIVVYNVRAIKQICFKAYKTKRKKEYVKENKAVYSMRSLSCYMYYLCSIRLFFRTYIEAWRNE